MRQRQWAPRPNRRLSEEKVEEIRSLLTLGLSSKDIAAKVGCSSSSVVNWAHRLGFPVQSSSEKRPRVTPVSRVCRDCGVEKLAKDFHKDSETVAGISSWCKACEIKRRDRKDPDWRKKLLDKRKAEHQADPSKSRDRSLRSRFGMTLLEFKDILSSQGGVCVGCKRKPSPSEEKGFWHVDHDHACCPTQKKCGNCVRGVLCRNCNAVLGLIRDSSNTLINLAAYLEEWPGSVGPSSADPRQASGPISPSVPPHDGGGRVN